MKNILLALAVLLIATTNLRAEVNDWFPNPEVEKWYLEWSLIIPRILEGCSDEELYFYSFGRSAYRRACWYVMVGRPS